MPPKPDVRENHLEDTLLYSCRFHADRASLLCVDLGISEKYKPIIEKYIKFFGSKERTKRFYDLGIERFNEETILIGLICAICRTRVCSFEEALRMILTDKVNPGEAGRLPKACGAEGGLGHGDLAENAYLAEPADSLDAPRQVLKQKESLKALSEIL